MLWCAEKTQDDVVGNSGQGIYLHGWDITHRPDETHWMGGLGTWRHAEGVPHACTARRALLLEKITWGQVNPAREQMSLLQSISIFPLQKLEFYGEEGVCKTIQFNEMYETSLEFPEGWGRGLRLISPVGEVNGYFLDLHNKQCCSC